MSQLLGINEYAKNTLAKSYFTAIRLIIDRAVRKTRIMDTTVFLLHFDKMIGPVLGASRGEQNLLSELQKNCGITVKNNEIKEDELFNEEIRNNNFKDGIIKSSDYVEIGQDYEHILTNNNKFVFFRRFEFQEKNARGKEMFVIAFVRNKLKIEKDKFDFVTKFIEERVKKYYDLFDKGRIINESKINELIDTISKENLNPNEDQIIREYYNL
ncbi:MAG TPA: hypothetical protein VI790_01150 [Candidatus Nanoarchaeia archaeon]|nr:hypothetical protein [Candidatus Nanoarchaeia archaeon]